MFICRHYWWLARVGLVRMYSCMAVIVGIYSRLRDCWHVWFGLQRAKANIQQDFPVGDSSQKLRLMVGTFSHLVAKPDEFRVISA